MEPLSIDAALSGSTSESGSVTPSRSQSPPPSNAIPIERPKLKGRQRLLQGLQRISSSPSLAKISRTPSTSYKGEAKASMSCVSLSSSANSYGHSYGSSYSSIGYSTAPSSAPGTPGSVRSVDAKCRIRFADPVSPRVSNIPSDILLSPRLGSEAQSTRGDYFAQPRGEVKKPQKRKNFSFWGEMPPELRIQILRYLKPREIVRCSVVSRSWHKMCFDGQLWSNLDTSEYYRDISADALVNIITAAGPFVRDLNLRGCVQLRERWNSKNLADACRNLENFSLEGCRIDRTSIHCFLLQNPRLVHVNLSGLPGATNSAMKIIAQYCPKLEVLNISWCNNIDTRGIRKVVENCANLRDLRAGEVRGWDDVDFMAELYKRNTLERLVLMNCDSLNDDSLIALIQGVEPEIDYLSGRPNVPPRRLKHLDLTHCRGVSDVGIKALAHNVPNLEGLQLSKCHALSDESLRLLLPTLNRLTHLDLEELDGLNNATLQTLAASPCASHLKHLSISYCEHLGDSGMLPVLRACSSLATLDMDNTRISDLVLTEAAACVRARNRGGPGLVAHERPKVGLRLVAFDCANVTWTGVREILSRNAEITRPSPPNAQPTYPREVIALKCFYNWQPTVEEHTKRVMRGDFAAAARLERKWTDWMMLNEEAGAGGSGNRRRRRRAREAQMLHADEEEGGMGAGIGAGASAGMVRRRRARSGPGGCTIM